MSGTADGMAAAARFNGPFGWNRSLPIDGGVYTVTARAPGANPWSTLVTVGGEGDTRTVEIPNLRNLPRDLTPSAAATSSPPARPAPVVPAIERTRAPSHPSRTVPIILGAGVLVLLGGGLGLELWAESKYDAAKSEMTSRPRRDSLYDAANTRRYVAEGLAVSGVAVAGAAVWVYVHGGNRPPDTTSLHIVPSPTELAVAGRF
jgi:hypothetical protein